MKRFKKALTMALLIGGIVAGIFYYIGTNYEDEIYLYYRDNILKVKDNIKIERNEYYKDRNYDYVQNTDDFVVKDQKHLLNIFYTIINSGVDEFTFYCDKSYETCITDVTTLVNDKKDILSDINNFVHPYNSFANINTAYDEYGEVNVKITKVYTKEEIALINQKVDDIMSKNIKNNMTPKQKIEAIHDYIINHGKYATDTFRKEKNNNYSKANNILFDGYGICSAYADAMAIFLYKMGIDNYRIASDSHIWNLVYLNKKWYHLDLTWDDPITQDGTDRLDKTFLLINTKKLTDLKVEKHNYDKNIYKEAA